jgi:DNA-binding CsgD family transcriptional regulator
MLDEVELRVAELAAAGTGIDAIAVALGVSANAVREHLNRVYRKLGGMAAH